MNTKSSTASSLFECKSVLKEIQNTIASHHPWEKSIKKAFSNRIKYAHNSIKNPVYPKPTNKKRRGNIKFIVLGVREAKEFIYCTHLVKGLHKYRSKIFDVPEIKDVTSAEWPEIWNNIKVTYGSPAYLLTSPVVIFKNDELFGGVQEIKEFLEGRYIYHLCLDYHKEAVKEFYGFVNATGRAFAYLQIAIDDKPVGTMIFMLYSDIVPMTCENFLRLCNTKKGGYSGTPVHRIVKDGWIQCGGFSLKDADMICENFSVAFNKRGIIGMCNGGRDVDCSTQFFVILQPADWMDSEYVAFGQLVDGEETLKKIESVPTLFESPVSSIIIYNSGALDLDCQHIAINKNSREYINKHIDHGTKSLSSVAEYYSTGEMLYEMLMQSVWAEIEARRLRKKQLDDLVELNLSRTSNVSKNVKRNKHVAIEIPPSDLNFANWENKSQNSYNDDNDKTVKQVVSDNPDLFDEYFSNKHVSIEIPPSDLNFANCENKTHNSYNDDNDKNVKEVVSDNLDLSYECYSNEHVSIEILPSDLNFANWEYKMPNSYNDDNDKNVKQVPFYLPLTDVPYFDEVDSTFDLKRFLKGNYCLENDLQHDLQKNEKKLKFEYVERSPEPDLVSGDSDNDLYYDMDKENDDIDSSEEEEIKNYIRDHGDRVSFAGGTIGGIVKEANTMFNIFEGMQRSERVTDKKNVHFRLTEARNRRPSVKKKEMTCVLADEDIRQLRSRQRQLLKEKDMIDVEKVEKVKMQPGLLITDDAPNKESRTEHELGYLERLEHEEETVEEKQPKEIEQQWPKSRSFDKQTQRRQRRTEFTDGDGSVLKAQLSSEKKTPTQVKRCPTGFIRPEELERMKGRRDEEEEESVKQEENFTLPRIPSASTSVTKLPSDKTSIDRRESKDQRTDSRRTDNKASGRKSTFAHLLEGVKMYDDDSPPTLKNYKTVSERIRQNITLTRDHNITDSSEITFGKNQLRPSIPRANFPYEELVKVQFGRKVKATISSEYVKKINQMERHSLPEILVSLRCKEYAKRRPQLTMEEYKQRNRQRTDMIKQKKSCENRVAICEDKENIQNTHG